MTLLKLPDGDSLMVHGEEWCRPPCAIHAPLPGPWSEWPLDWKILDPDRSENQEENKDLVRICPHGVRHPLVESMVHWAQQGKDDKARHYCDGCPCVPDGVLSDDLRIGIHTAEDIADFYNNQEWEEETSDDTPILTLLEDPSLPKSAYRGPDPNRVAKEFLDRWARVIGDGENTLVGTLRELVKVHDITVIQKGRGEGNWRLEECTWDCSDIFTPGNATTDDNTCVTLKLALLGGYVPERWVSEDR